MAEAESAEKEGEELRAKVKEATLALQGEQGIGFGVRV